MKMQILIGPNLAAALGPEEMKRLGLTVRRTRPRVGPNLTIAEFVESIRRNQ